MSEELGKRVRAARGYANLSQAALAEALTASQRMIARVELGERDLKPHELEAIAKACGIPAAFFTAPFSRMEDR